MGLTKKDCDVLFGYTETILQLNGNFLLKLEDRLGRGALARGDEDVAVGDIFREFAPFFKMYDFIMDFPTNFIFTCETVQLRFDQVLCLRR